MTTEEAFQNGRAAGLEEAAELLHTGARILVCGKKRTNQFDRHTSAVLCRARDDIRSLKTTIRTVNGPL